MPVTGESITDEQLARAAYLRHVESLDWEAIAKDIGCVSMTLRAARHTDRWEEACKPYEVAKADLRRISYTALEKQIRAGKFEAIIQGIDRSEGSVKQQTELSGNVGMYPIPVFSETDPLNNFHKEAEGDCETEAAAEETSA